MADVCRTLGREGGPLQVPFCGVPSSLLRRRALRGALALAVAVGLAVLLAGKPPLLMQYGSSRVVRDRDGVLLRMTLAPDQAFRSVVRLSEIPPTLVEATLLYEDRYFRQHPGINPVALLKAALQTYAQGGARRGGSTLTMQLARLHFHLETRSVVGKLLQCVRAAQLELWYSKDELLEAFLNLAPYGGNVQGVGAASLIYFHKEPAALTLPEAMALAVMPQSPTQRSPLEGREPASLTRARGRLAAQWIAAHPEAEHADLALEVSLTLGSARQLPFLAPHAVERALATAQGERLALTLDATLQAQLERKLTHYLGRHQREGLRNAVALVADVETGEVLAHVGSADFFDVAIDGQVDGARAPRSPGSALKPLVYARALDEGLIHPRTLLADVPLRLGLWNPENFDLDFLGPISAQQALVKSRNIPAIALDQQLRTGLYEVLQAAQVRGLGPKARYGAGLVLGGAEVTAFELLGLYVALGAGGRWAPLRHLRGEPRGAPVPLVSAEAAALTLQMLTEQRAPDGSARGDDAAKVAWKTGTSYAFRDAWTAGVVGHFALVVWVGDFEGAGNANFVGRSAAAPLFFELVDALRPRLSAQAAGPVAPLALETMQVCAVSGRRPSPHCRHTVPVRVIPGVSPVDACEVHRSVPIVVATGEQACRVQPPRTREEIFEVWPTALARQFERAGLARAQPPPLEPGCVAAAGAPTAGGPTILSPQAELSYALRRGAAEQARLPLLANADGQARVLTWFSGAELLGTSAPGKVLDWSPASGRHHLRVVDERGRSAQLELEVRWVE